jgi:membrane protein YdbS with pleckstrin-like domain
MTHTLGSLTEALNFSAEDLDANRAGRLSDRQKYRLTRGWRRTLWILIGLVIFLGLAATTMLFVAQRGDSPVLNVIGILLTIINAAIVALGTQSYLHTSSDIKNGRVTIISGIVSHTIRVSGRVATYILKVDNQEVVVSKLVFFAVEDGKPYHFYRVPASKTLLSAEPA